MASSARQFPRLAAAAAVVAFAVCGFPLPAEESPGAAPRAEDYDAQRTLSYMARARDFLREKPASASVPRVLFEMAMIATIEKDQTLSAEIYTRLILEHPESLYARYAVAVWPDAKGYREFLKQVLKSHENDLQGDFSTAYSQAVSIGVKHWGPTLLADDGFALDTALAAYVAGDLYLESLCRAQLEKSKSEAHRAIVEIALGPGSDAEKAARLHALDENQAKRFTQFFLGRLSADDRRRPDMLRVQAECCLEDGRLEDALPLVEQLVAGHTEPRALFQLAWCHAALGRSETAKADIERLRATSADSPWTAQALELLPHLDNIAAATEANADAVIAAVERLRGRDTEIVEGSFVYRRENGSELHCYVAAFLKEGGFDVAIAEAGRLLLGYQARGSQSRIYFDGEPAIQAFQRKATYPVFATNVSADASGQFNFNWNFNFRDSPDALSQSQFTLPPGLLTRGNISALVQKSLISRGRIPCAPREENGQRVFRWLCPDAREPGIDCWEYRIDAAGRLVSFHSKSLACTRLQYGSRDDVRLNPPAWPDLPVVTREEMDPSAMFRALGVLASLLNPPAETTAAKAVERK